MIKTYEITLPVLNEEACLAASVHQILVFFNENNLSNWSLAIADNGSTDKTLEISKSLQTQFSDRIRVVSLDTKGVGIAVRESWTSSNADVVGYMDIDLATALIHLIDVKNLFEDNLTVKIVNGSRRLRGSKVRNRKWVRAFTSYNLNILLAILLRVRFTDAMCGFKFFDRQLALELLQKTPDNPDWFVCAELLIRAEWQGLIINEIPVVWIDDPISSVQTVKLSCQYIKHIQRLFFEKIRS